MYQCSKKLVKHKEYSCFDHSDFLAHSMFTFDVCWGSLGTSIFGNSSSAANNTRSRLPSRLSFRFLWQCSHTKVPLIFWFLIATFNSCFYHQLWVKLVCIHIGINSGHIGQTHLWFPKCLWMFDKYSSNWYLWEFFRLLTTWATRHHHFHL